MNKYHKALFSPNGEFFAFADKQGILKIWKTSTNTIKHVLNSCDTFTCSSLTWGSILIGNTAADNVKIRNEIHSKDDCLVIGTETGEIVVYNIKAEKFFSHFGSAHQDAVTDLQWDSSSNCLFSCSKDKSIAVWRTDTGNIKHKWETDGPLYSICVIDSDNLLSAGLSILWWNVHDQTVIKKFSGHSAEILNMLPVISTDKSSNSYFLSVAAGETKINAWHLSVKNSMKSVASFDLPSKLQSIDVTKYFSKEKPMCLSAVMEKGSLLLFKHVLNGKAKVNLLPQITLKVVSRHTGETSIPVICSKISHDSESCIIAYGTIENPVFEKVELSNLSKTLTLERDLPELKNSAITETIPEVKIYNKLGDYISTNGQLPSHNLLYSNPKRKKKDPLVDTVVSVSEGITNDRCGAQSSNQRTIPTSMTHSKKKLRKIPKQLSELSDSETQVIQDTAVSDPSSIAEIISRSLQTEDVSLLDTVFQCNEEELIRNTIMLLPDYCVTKFVKELHQRLSNVKHRYNSNVRKWLKEALNTHLEYLKTCPDLEDTFEQIRDVIDRKNVHGTLSKLSLLRGILNVQRLQHISRHTNSDSDTDEQMDS